ncbi:MAG TPA: ABC transporter substrate-binding protein, partial [Candidatus Obscuribacterales bacterium]
FDPQAAEEMLAQAGFGRQGLWWRYPDGSRLAFSILTVKDYQDVAQAICGDLAKLGVFTEVQIVEFSTLRQQYLKRGQYQAVVWSRSVGPDPECLLSWHSRGPLNFSRFRDARLDGLLEAGRRTGRKEKRKQVYSKVQEILATQLPWVFLFHPTLIVAHGRRVTHIKEPGQEKTGLPWDNPLFNAAGWVKN